MRSAIAELAGSQIRQVVDAGANVPDVLRFWFGESDEVTHPQVREAAMQSLRDGETFYNANLGLTPLREAIAAYTAALHPHTVSTMDAQRIAVTSSGVSALMLAMQALVDAGDEVVVVTPIWPNLPQQALIMGAKLHAVPLRAQDGGWVLDLPALLASITPRTKVLLINSPNNPTGWTLTGEEQQSIAAHCRSTGTWIVADEVYERLYYGEPHPVDAPVGGRVCAPSFLDMARVDDRLIVTQSFSKTFLMTGWRLGWLVLPQGMSEHMGKLIEFNTSCAPTFVQRAGLAALRLEPEITPRMVADFKHCRDTLVPLLQQLPRVSVQSARGGMYAFFKLEGFDDSLTLAKRLVLEAKLGLAPGTAFTPVGQSVAQGWLRWCFASKDTSRLEQGVQRLAAWLQHN